MAFRGRKRDTGLGKAWGGNSGLPSCRLFIFRYLFVREVPPTLALFTQLSLESLARTELVSLVGSGCMERSSQCEDCFTWDLGSSKSGGKMALSGGAWPWGSVFSLLLFLSSRARMLSMGWVVFPALYCHGLSWVCGARTLPAGAVAEFSEPIFQSNY